MFYFSGHGVIQKNGGTYAGALEGTDGNYVTSAELAQLLKNVPGKVIIILDSDSSGSTIARSAGASEDQETTFDPKRFTQSFCQAFEAADVYTQEKSGECRVSNKFYVLTSSADKERAYTQHYFKPYNGFFSLAFCIGCGYDYQVPPKRLDRMYADANNDNAISLEEAYRYCYSYTKKLSKDGQHVQRYPENSNQIIYDSSPVDAKIVASSLA